MENKNIYELLNIHDFVLNKEKINELKNKYIYFLLFNCVNKDFRSMPFNINTSLDFHTLMLEMDINYVINTMKLYREKAIVLDQFYIALYAVYSYNRNYFEDIFKNIIKSPEDILNFISVVNKITGGEGGRCIKRNITKFLNKCDIDTLVNYSEYKNTYSLSDLVLCSHPKPEDIKHMNVYRYLRKQDFDYKLIPNGFKYKKYLKASNNKLKASIIKKFNIQYDMIKYSIQNDFYIWKEILPSMNANEILDNIYNLEKENIFLDIDCIKIILNKLDSDNNINLIKLIKSNNINNQEIKNKLFEAFKKSLNNENEFFKKIYIFLDMSSILDDSLMNFIKYINFMYKNVYFVNNIEKNKDFNDKHRIYISDKIDIKDIDIYESEFIILLNKNADISTNSYVFEGISEKNINIIKYLINV